MIPDVAALLKAHPEAVSLGQGVPGYGPPEEVVHALMTAPLDPAWHRYQAGDGMADLVNTWRARLVRENAIPTDAGAMMVTAGSNMAFLQLMAVIADPGDEVILPAPYFFNQRMALEELGMDPDIQAAFASALARPNGIILVTGPTGSGKTTSLYAALSRLNDGSRNILTVEDPVEYALDGIGQTQVNNAVGMSFAAGLRAILRQDPDVVMVGEIRDPETAEIAVQASLTGHLVMSTVHTNSAIASVARLRDMGVEPFLLSSTLTALVAQRLVRRFCDECKTPYTPSAAEQAELGLKKGRYTFYKPEGCPACSGVGYTGRLGLYEIVPMDETLRGMIHDGATESEMAAHAFTSRQTLLEDGADKVKAGLTSSDEVLRVCRTDEL